MYRVCAVLVVVVLAGCAGMGADTAERGDGPSETVTPVPVPDDDRGAVGSTGIDGDGVSDPAALARAHDERLSEQSYRLVSNQTVRYGNGSVKSQYRTDLRLDEERTYFVTARTDGPDGPLLLGETPASAAFWSDGDTYVRAFGGSEPVYNEFEPSPSGVGTWRFWSSTGAFDGLQSPRGVIEATFDAVPTRIDRTRTIGGVERHRVTDAGHSDVDLPFPEADPARDVSLVAEIDRTGLVRHLELEYVGRVDGERVTVTRSVSYSEVGTTDVPRPEWYDEAV